jgi:hypothetical protein
MNTLAEIAQSASFQSGNIVVVFEGGKELRFPVEKNPRLAKGNPGQLERRGS